MDVLVSEVRQDVVGPAPFAFAATRPRHASRGGVRCVVSARWELAIRGVVGLERHADSLQVADAPRSLRSGTQLLYGRDQHRDRDRDGECRDQQLRARKTGASHRNSRSRENTRDQRQARRRGPGLRACEVGSVERVRGVRAPRESNWNYPHWESAVKRLAEVHRASFKSRLIRFHSRSGNWANGCERIFRISRVGPHANGFRLVPCIAFKYTFRA